MTTYLRIFVLAATVATAACGGGAGGINPDPVLNSVSPTFVHAGADATLTLRGRDFVDSSTVIWTAAGTSSGITVTPSSIADTMLTVVIPVALIGPLGDAILEVQNPQPGGGTSTAIIVPVV